MNQNSDDSNMANGDEGSRERTKKWTFLTNHAHVLMCVAKEPDLRLRDIAERVQITERATQLIISDLIAEGYVVRSKVGRRNNYHVNGHGRMRHPMFRELAIQRLLDLLDHSAAQEASASQ